MKSEHSLEAERRAAEDSKRDPHTLLEQIHYESLHEGNTELVRLGFTIAKFASLLCVLSERAEKQTKSVIKLTGWLIVLTLLLFILTLYLCFDIFEKRHGLQESADRAKVSVVQPKSIP